MTDEIEIDDDALDIAAGGAAGRGISNFDPETFRGSLPEQPVISNFSTHHLEPPG